MAIILQHPAPDASAPNRQAVGTNDQRRTLPYTVTDDFAMRDKAVPFWTGIKAALGRPPAHR